MYADFKGKAIEFAKVAVQEDEAGNFEKAINHYLNALDYFKTHLKYEKNESSRQAITAKFKEYLARAEYLKAQLARQVAEPASAPPGDAVQKPKAKNDKEDEKKSREENIDGAIVADKPDVKWGDVAGLEGAKEALKEAVILPVKFPQFFTGKRKPWSGLLLYGPPGTGKSHLAKAVATEADSTFFSVSSADLVSKWMGESEKLVVQLFKAAKEKAPSIVFIDEIDSLGAARGDSESEAARRIKTQLLIEITAVKESSERVLILGATNLPYMLDNALRRRFDKRIYIALPEQHARAHMFKVHLGDTPHNLTEKEFQALAAKTEGFSGSDIAVVVKGVLMEPIKVVQGSQHFKRTRDADGQMKYTPCAPDDTGAEEKNLQWFMENDPDSVLPPPITYRDFEKVLLKARPTVSPKDLGIFQQFTEEFGEES
ncbi:unnamed protein product [Ostreobium quekettii]|uniref:Vesicle-fusing ATPase n=1 Tax=Ostreobium quekettii TaxID=121088 RepID=A0A8S1JEL5_9CHLO|nr:unnamed protein product [Ostreobium quekettii]|eukprot:evm.model.scf_169EXC.2 EVM.evm.TU.scf_169EXC.2   scf_169EXC:57207-61686(-)